ncbi:MAG: ROK family protein [Bdellovibrionales bacterium]|nr:ROK family protein [Bdellovibrionales bacterium]
MTAPSSRGRRVPTTNPLTLASRGRVALAYDLGGTKVEAALVRDDGKVMKSERLPVRVDAGPSGLVAQMAELGRALLALPEGRRVRAVGLASAGPLDPRAGVLFDPTNLFTAGKGWGKVPIARLLSAKLKLPVTLENDAAAAILAEKWKGAARRAQNAVMLTLGTGLGVGVICDGALVRAGRGLHPEGGHVLLKYGDASAPCACGTLGCAEAFLSGAAFGRRAVQVHQVSGARDSAEITARAREKDPASLAAFAEYAELLAAAIQTYVVLYSPELIVLAGSFAQAADLFLPQMQPHLKRRLSRRRVGVDLLPRVEVSRLHNHAGVLGGAFVALRSKPHP